MLELYNPHTYTNKLFFISDLLGVQLMYHHTHAVLQILESIKNTTTIIDSALQGSKGWISNVQGL